MPPSAAHDPTTASPRTAREINDRLVLDLLGELQRPATVTQLRELTGLSRPTVATVLRRLLDAGLIEMLGASEEVLRGPNAKTYGLRARLAHVAGIDARTDTVDIALSDLTGTRVLSVTVPVDTAAAVAPGPVIDVVVNTLHQASDKAFGKQPHAIAIGAPGLVEPVTGVLRSTGWPPAWHAAMIDRLRTAFDGLVLVDNEVNLATLAEQRNGAAQDLETFALLWVGQGVGAGLMFANRLLKGVSGGAGEIGFLPVPGKRRRAAALHDVIGALSVCTMAARHGLLDADQSGSPVRAAADAVALAAAELPQTPAARAFLDELAASIADAVLALSAIFDPGHVFLSGEVCLAGGERLAELVTASATPRSPVPIEVGIGSAGSDAVLAGALAVALDRARDDLFGPQWSAG